MNDLITTIIENSQDRYTLCTQLINKLKLETVAEIGVYRGEFAEYLLKQCPSISNYTMIDPWRNLADWNKPANKDDDTFNQYYQETINKTNFAKEKIKILRGKTTEVIGQIEDNTFDFVYIDGDHTLKGITLDLISLWPKVKENGIILGDDFSPSIWQHSHTFEPSMIFPFAVYFAEAMKAKIYGLPYDQFMIIKNQSGFQFIDECNGKYSNLTLRTQFLKKPRSSLRNLIKSRFPLVIKIYAAFK